MSDIMNICSNCLKKGLILENTYTHQIRFCCIDHFYKIKDKVKSPRKNIKN